MVSGSARLPLHLPPINNKAPISLVGGQDVGDTSATGDCRVLVNIDECHPAVLCSIQAYAGVVY